MDDDTTGPDDRASGPSDGSGASDGSGPPQRRRRPGRDELEERLRPAGGPASDDGLRSPSDSAVPGREGVGRDETGTPVVTRPATNPVLRALGVVRIVLDRALAAACVLMFLLLVFIVSWQVFTRQVMNDPATWTEESARYTFVVLAMLATAYVFSERGHIAVELLAEKFPPTAQKVIAAAVQVTIIFFALFVFVYGGYRVAQNAWGQNVSTLPLTVGQIYMILPAAGLLITYYAIYHLIAVFVGTEEAVPETDENLQGT